MIKMKCLKNINFVAQNLFDDVAIRDHYSLSDFSQYQAFNIMQSIGYST